MWSVVIICSNSLARVTSSDVLMQCGVGKGSDIQGRYSRSLSIGLRFRLMASVETANVGMFHHERGAGEGNVWGGLTLKATQV
ncbi:hypothetical protein T440DRAFT_213490 [Plenodomus tracheiphilus IPT5]|uniref:Uncharacterized protein n=1 Tax=Plenodomus tracheiphilus IPT5 TaxID=1408161 RepID=A0A6A7AV01_9PLEO|nr:hypothetical protein T440DRAFT_213490 [Plenodomus tracheiphilus IPT5]